MRIASSKYSWGKFWVLPIALLFVIPKIGASQTTDPVLDSLLIYVKNFSINKGKLLAQEVADNTTRDLFTAYFNYLDNGAIALPTPKIRNSASLRERAINHFLWAKLASLKEALKDSLIYKNYTDALNIAKKQNDTLLVTSLLHEINYFLDKNGAALELFKRYAGQISLYANNNTDYFWDYFYRVRYLLRVSEVREKKLDTVVVNKLITHMFSHAKTDYLKGQAHLHKAIYQDVFLKKKVAALSNYIKAEQFYQKTPHNYSLKRIVGIKFNKASLHYEQKEYQKALHFFLKHHKKESNKLYRMYSYEWIYKSYEALKKNDSAYLFFKKMTALKDSINQSRTALRINKIEFSYDLEKKGKALTAALQLSQKSKKQRSFFLIGIVIFACISIIAYLLAQKLRKKSDSLEKEKSETITHLEELKKVVTKDFIQLKDKTKVYVSDLMYIKSDDHYLRVFIKNGKTNFVRGKLTQIYKQLPPNFKQSHRSYLVNINFIKQVQSSFLTLIDGTEIPISKTYREQFE